MKDVLTGKLVRLSAFDPEEMSKAFPRWNLNSEYLRLLNSSAASDAISEGRLKWMEKEAGEMSPAQLLLQHPYAGRRQADRRTRSGCGELARARCLCGAWHR